MNDNRPMTMNDRVALARHKRIKSGDIWPEDKPDFDGSVTYEEWEARKKVDKDRGKVGGRGGDRMKLVKLPDGNHVNPEYVTCIEYADIGATGMYTLVWVIANSGYHTQSFRFKGDVRDELAQLIQANERRASKHHGHAQPNEG